jgi:two-component system NarL family sensor kinase
MMIYVTALTAMLLLLSLYIISMLRRTQLKEINSRNTMIQLKRGYEQKLKEVQLEMQAQIFREISNEIHDNISLHLNLCKLQLLSLNFRKPADMIEKLNSSINLVSRTITALSNISKGFDPEFIPAYGLANAIENEVKHLETTEMFKMDFRVTGTSSVMVHPTDLILFRIFRESINNIIKHANATSIEIVLIFRDDLFECSISDNGIGINPEKLTRGCGLRNMEKRAYLLGATLEINSVPGSGTQIKILLPLPKPQ